VHHSQLPRIEPITIAAPLTLLIGDTGLRSATRMPVGEVRRRWQADSAGYEALFAQIGALVAQARAALGQGDARALGALLNYNHQLLQQIGVSSPELDALVAAAQAAGALGAKLSGAGWGGVMLAVITSETSEPVAAALAAAGAKRVIATPILPHAASPQAESSVV
jgi:mevalonate kinase